MSEILNVSPSPIVPPVPFVPRPEVEQALRQLLQSLYSPTIPNMTYAEFIEWADEDTLLMDLRLVDLRLVDCSQLKI